MNALAKNVLRIDERMTASIFALQIRRATSNCRHVSFSLVHAKTGKLGKQSDAKKFGFFIEPQEALDVLKLIGAQVEAANAKLANEDAAPASGLI